MYSPVRAYLTYVVWSAKFTAPIVAVGGFIFAIIGAIDVIKGDERGWQTVQFGFGLSAFVIGFGWAWLKLYRRIDRWMSRVD